MLRAVSGCVQTPPSTAKHVMGRGKKKKKKTSFRKKWVLVLFPPHLSPQGAFSHPFGWPPCGSPSSCCTYRSFLPCLLT